MTLPALKGGIRPARHHTLEGGDSSPPGDRLRRSQ
jgi:hypothetical protein